MNLYFFFFFDRALRRYIFPSFDLVLGSAAVLLHSTPVMKFKQPIWNLGS
jgi:hypothetical protein